MLLQSDNAVIGGGGPPLRSRRSESFFRLSLNSPTARHSWRRIAPARWRVLSPIWLAARLWT